MLDITLFKQYLMRNNIISEAEKIDLSKYKYQIVRAEKVPKMIYTGKPHPLGGMSVVLLKFQNGWQTTGRGKDRKSAVEDAIRSYEEFQIVG